MIELRDINKTYLVGEEPLHALRDVSLRVNDGDYISVMGPSGSGKSTLLNMLGLLDRPDSGQYLLDGLATEKLPEEKRAAVRRDNIGFIFQSFHLINRLTAFENVELPLVLAGEAPKNRRKRVEEMLATVGLTNRMHHRPNQLSGGQLQRVAIARALLMKPRLLLADEPTGNLDQASGKEIVEALEKLNAEGITLLVVTHDQALGQRATRQIVMRDGSIVEDNGKSHSVEVNNEHVTD